MITKAPRGTKDLLPDESYKWQYIERVIRRITKLFCYMEIRTPTFEHTELFVRGVGDTTDIVQKEMYTFFDKGERSITLKPEGTAGTVRSYIEHGLYNITQPVKMYYITPVFRYENPQAGRLREHHQFGVEAFGGPEASLDAEIITLAITLFNELGLRGLEVDINSIGCANCRPRYLEGLREYFKDHLDNLCNNCVSRYERNPLRILDCKNERCTAIRSDAPIILDYLCEDCKVHFQELQQYLSAASIEFKVNPMIVRGLDYYSKTVFEILSPGIGAQNTVCGGGRYDGLVSECGGPKTPGAGFGLGIERLLLTLENQGIEIPRSSTKEVLFVTIGEKARSKAFELLNNLRVNGISADMDHLGRSVKAQFKYADRVGFSWVCTLGEDELESGTVSVRSMDDGREESIPQNMLIDYITGEKGAK
ncbi:MAG: histidine--tRNA ligase [Clostridiales bacterium]|nr:histidine--tRNA ligase [Clostridiales bacterium]